MRCATWTRFDRLLLFISIKNKVTSAAITGLGIAVEKRRERGEKERGGGKAGSAVCKSFQEPTADTFH